MESLVLPKERGRERECVTGWGSARGVPYFVVFHKVHEGRALDLHRLPLPVVERQDEMKEVGFPQVRRGLLLKMSPGQGDPAAQEETQGDSDKGKRERTTLPKRPERGPGATSGRWRQEPAPWALFQSGGRSENSLGESRWPQR